MPKLDTICGGYRRHADKRLSFPSPEFDAARHECRTTAVRNLNPASIGPLHDRRVAAWQSYATSPFRGEGLWRLYWNGTSGSVRAGPGLFVLFVPAGICSLVLFLLGQTLNQRVLRRVRSGLCVSCGYNLFTPSPAPPPICPECGEIWPLLLPPTDEIGQQMDAEPTQHNRV